MFCSQIMRVAQRDGLDLMPYKPPFRLPNLGILYAEISPLSESRQGGKLKEADLIARLLRRFEDQVCIETLLVRACD